MTAKRLLNLTVNDLIIKIKGNVGLGQFAFERSKFEGWLKVEIIDILFKKNINAKPEINRIDVTFKDTAIELKTINTNYRFNNVKNKKRPITKNIKGILKDISDLKRKVTKNKFVIFIVFPVIVNNSYWAIHIHKIQKELSELTFKEFKFNNSIPGLIYYGKL